MKDYIQIHESDNVIVAIKEIDAGERVRIGTLQIEAKDAIPAGHKMALCDIPEGGKESLSVSLEDGDVTLRAVFEKND